MNIEPINIFDFDGTLTTETWPKCLVWIKRFGYNGAKRNDALERALAEHRKTHKGDEHEIFFAFFHELLISNNAALTNEELMEGEKYIEYNPGLKDFIKESTAKNYIISAGLKDFLKNLELAKYFDEIYGTSIEYDSDGLICGIKEVMTDDKKVLSIKEILRINNREENDCRNVYYIGDGYSDAPAMRYVHDHGGIAIFVHELNQEDELYEYNSKIYQTLNANGMIDFCCIADYSDNSMLSNILQRKKVE